MTSSRSLAAAGQLRRDLAKRRPWRRILEGQGSGSRSGCPRGRSPRASLTTMRMIPIDQGGRLATSGCSSMVRRRTWACSATHRRMVRSSALGPPRRPPPRPPPRQRLTRLGDTLFPTALALSNRKCHLSGHRHSPLQAIGEATRRHIRHPSCRPAARRRPLCSCASSSARRFALGHRRNGTRTLPLLALPGRHPGRLGGPPASLRWRAAASRARIWLPAPARPTQGLPGPLVAAGRPRTRLRGRHRSRCRCRRCWAPWTTPSASSSSSCARLQHVTALFLRRRTACRWDLSWRGDQRPRHLLRGLLLGLGPRPCPRQPFPQVCSAPESDERMPTQRPGMC